MTRKDYKVLARFINNVYLQAQHPIGLKASDVKLLLVEQLCLEYSNFAADKFLDYVTDQNIRNGVSNNV